MPVLRRSGLKRKMVMLLAAVGTAACAAQDSQRVLIVYAASSLQDAVQDVSRSYRRAGGDSLIFVFGSTTELSEQIANGAPADLLLAADAQTIDRLSSRHVIVDSSQVVFARGQLALVSHCQLSTPRECPALPISALASPTIRFVAMANPAYAPYGVAARQALERSGLWKTVESRVVMAANVAQVEQFVSSGNADAGFVAVSLVARRDQRTFTIIDSSLHDPLRHTAAVTRASNNAAASLRFLQFVLGDSAQAILATYGFASPDSMRRQ